MFKNNSFKINLTRSKFENVIAWIKTAKRRISKVSDVVMVKVLNSKAITEKCNAQVVFVIKDLQTSASVVKRYELEVSPLDEDSDTHLTQTFIASDLLISCVNDNIRMVSLSFYKNVDEKVCDRDTRMCSVSYTTQDRRHLFGDEKDTSECPMTFMTYKELNTFDHMFFEKICNGKSNFHGVNVDFNVDSFIRWINVLIFASLFTFEASVVFKVDKQNMELVSRNNWNVVFESKCYISNPNNMEFEVEVTTLSLFFCKNAIESVLKKKDFQKKVVLWVCPTNVFFAFEDNEAFFVAQSVDNKTVR